VIATSPLNSKVNICKRVHRIGGEICDGYTDADMVVPYGYVYLVGENSKVSRDSNDYGAIPYGLIQSRVLVKVIDFYMAPFYICTIKNCFEILDLASN
jgi:inner membrane protease subunit 1